MSVYTTKKGQQGDLVLHINGNQSICPYVQALPMQGQYGQIQIMRLPCTSSCPHVRLTDDNERLLLVQGLKNGATIPISSFYQVSIKAYPP